MFVVSGCLSDTPQGGSDLAIEPGIGGGNSAPSISGSPDPAILTGDMYSFMPSASDSDGDALTFSIRNRPQWATFGAKTGQLSGQALLGDEGVYNNIEITVSDGGASTSLPGFSITVSQASPSNSAPTISGTPSSQINANSQYRFTPSANDADGDTLTFSVSGLPGWASFSTSNGRISGTPGDADVRTYNNISIAVSDGSASATLGPFSITVVDNNANAAPTISGNPPAQVNANDPYSFTPSANDADGNSLTFSVSGLPGWASFSTSNGRITGTPSDANVGTYNNISITVSDGSASATLGPFSITVNAVSLGSVTLSWTPPTKNDDGTTLTDLSGHKIYWGTESGSYPNSTKIDNPGISTYVVENLASGTYEFVVTSFNSEDVESVYSNVAVKTVTSN